MMSAPVVAFVGLHVGEGRLEGEVLHELYVLAVGEVDAVSGADDCVLDGAPCDADAWGEVVALGFDEGARVFAGEWADLIRLHGDDGSEVVACVEVHEAVVFLRIGREVFVAESGRTVRFVSACQLSCPKRSQTFSRR